MNAEFIAMLDYLERERGIKREILLEAVSNALLSASKKSVGAARDRALMARRSGKHKGERPIVHRSRAAPRSSPISCS